MNHARPNTAAKTVNTGPYKYVSTNVDDIAPPRLKLQYYSKLNLRDIDYSIPLDKSTKEETYELTLNNPLGPLNSTKVYLRDIFHKLIYAEISFSFYNIYIQKTYPECLQWDIRIGFDFTVRGGRIATYLMYDIGLCETTQQATNIDQILSTPVMWISVAVMILAIVSFTLIIKAMWSTYRTLTVITSDNQFKSFYSSHQLTRNKAILQQQQQEDRKQQGIFNHSIVQGEQFYEDDEDEQTNTQQHHSHHHHHHQLKNDLSFWEKLGFFNPWHPITLVSSLLAFLSSVMTISNLTYRYYSLNPTNIALGMSAILVWSNLVQYFAHAPKFYVLITALRKGLPNVIRFTIGSLPILIGFTMCGTILFGSYSRYVSIIIHVIVISGCAIC